MPKVTGEHIKEGQRIWIAGYDGEKQCSFPFEVEIVSAAVVYPNKILVRQMTQFERRQWHALHCRDDGLLSYFLGDSGIRPYNYDNRVTQAYTTKEEMKAAITAWNHQNPNDIEES